MAKTQAGQPANYEAALEELEQLVARVESGQMPLDQLLAGYQRGATLLAFCRQRLAGYKVPRSFDVHDELPRSEAGKLAKRTLRDPWWADRDRAI